MIVGEDKATPRTALSAAYVQPPGVMGTLHLQYLDSDGQLWYVTRQVASDAWGDPEQVEGATAIPGSRLAASGAGDGTVFVAYQIRDELEYNVLDRDVGYDRKSDGPRTTPAPHKICCIYPKKSSIATKLESRDHYIVENK